MSKNDGGPAYPTLGRELTDMTGAVVTSGMSIRDWFAGQALAGMMADEGSAGVQWTLIAENCFLAADAMLKARAKP